MTIATYKPPFPYFGGKSTIADAVWAGLGDVKNYVEPFCGSAAVLMLRPEVKADIGIRIETVNDADGFVANFWRAMKHDVEAVAEYADWPVNECDLHARHLWLVGQRENLTARLCGDPDWFDAKTAGWWCWGVSCWIGSGWCSGRGPWVKGDDGSMVLSNAGQGVNRQRPHLGDAGQGVNRQRNGLLDYLREFSDRLANVRVCCGDWERVCGPSVTIKHGTTGVFLDPPYADTAGRAGDLYAVDCQSVAHRVREWAIANGTHPDMRIVLAGYEGEHAMPGDWRVVEWKTKGGFGSQGDDAGKAGRLNARRERLWFSPHCLTPETSGLWGGIIP